MRCLVLALSFVVALAPSAVFGQAAKDPAPCDPWNSAGPVNAQALIASCTHLIDSGKLSGRALARAYLTRILANSGQTRAIDHGQIIADATKLIETDAQGGFAYVPRGDSYLRRGEYERALRDATKAIELNATDVTALSFRSSIYQAKGDYDLAIADDTKAVEAAPKAPFTYANRASTYLKAGKTEEAIADYRNALQLEPNNKGHREALGRLGATP